VRILRNTVLAALLCAAGCTVGPDYEKPTAATTPAFKEGGEAWKVDADQPWKVGQPADEKPRGDWWAIYNDPALDDLEKQIDISNENLKASEANYRAARAIVQQAVSTLFPTVTANAGVVRSGAGVQSNSNNSSVNFSGQSGAGSVRAQTQYTLTGGTTWEIDVWGRIRRTIESDVAAAQASAADLASARLLAQSQLATFYLQLRMQDELKRVLDDTAAAFEQTLRVTRNQYAAGIVSKADVASAETQLKSTQAQAINVGILRAQLEHAIAVLIGKPPSEFSIAPVAMSLDIPAIPPALPSTLLERRPDIASAERQMASANALIGVAISAYYPTISFSASGGFTGPYIDSLISAANQVWSFGPGTAQTLIDWGARGAQVDQARANYDQTVALYRQTVLTAFQQVEDQLAAMRILADQSVVQDQAVRSAQEAVRVTVNQYRSGIVPYTTVLVAQAQELSNEQAAVILKQNRFVASVALIQALGGGWSLADLPSEDAIRE
jgi:NodT family efflux transporter outer membrane factor (OMF) lipoprotein